MSLPQALRHNQSLVIAAIISILCFGGMFACHLTQAQKKEIISTAAIATEAVVTGTPIPWSQIGLTIGTILGSGAVVDNRRKDTLIKRLQAENANHLGIFTALVKPNSADPPRVPPINKN